MTAGRRWNGRAENLARLDNCVGPHRFVAMPVVAPQQTADLRCLDCGGVVSTVAAYWYAQGLDHGVEHGQRRGEAA